MASNNSAVVQNRDIFCGLPTYDNSVKGLKALVLGANGISGNTMLRALSEAPDRWTEITAISRRPPMNSYGIGKNVRHVQADLLQDPKEIAKILKDNSVKA
jgi:putative NADH-flavin reductase